MTLALNKYVNRKKDGEWNAPSEEEKQIAALKFSLEEFKKEISQLSKALKGRDGKGKSKKQVERKK